MLGVSSVHLGVRFEAEGKEKWLLLQLGEPIRTSAISNIVNRTGCIHRTSSVEIDDQ